MVLAWYNNYINKDEGLQWFFLFPVVVSLSGLVLAALAVEHNLAWEVQIIQKEIELRTIPYFNIFIRNVGRKPMLLSTDFMLPPALNNDSATVFTTSSRGSNRLLPAGID